MDVLTWKQYDYVLFPISFKIVNKNGQGDYFGGLDVDASVADDISHNFGDQHEACLKAALNFIEQGSFRQPLRVGLPTTQPEPTSWWDREFGAY